METLETAGDSKCFHNVIVIVENEAFKNYIGKKLQIPQRKLFKSRANS